MAGECQTILPDSEISSLTGSPLLGPMCYRMSRNLRCLLHFLQEKEPTLIGLGIACNQVEKVRPAQPPYRGMMMMITPSVPILLPLPLVLKQVQIPLSKERNVVISDRLF